MLHLKCSMASQQEALLRRSVDSASSRSRQLDVLDPSHLLLVRPSRLHRLHHASTGPCGSPWRAHTSPISCRARGCSDQHTTNSHCSCPTTGTSLWTAGPWDSGEADLGGG